MSQVTVGERILVHLTAYVRFSDAVECPHEMTQDGIAHALGISRAHAALELKRLKASGRVEERSAHVPGARSRRKVYHLTPSGAALARGLRDHARAKSVLLADGPERREARGAEAIEALKSRGLREGEAMDLVLTGDVVDLRAGRLPPDARGLPGSAGPFVGRDAELGALRAWLASPSPLALVLGVAGVGKTALAARAACAHAGPAWYRKVHGFEDARTFASALADFLHRADRPRLRSYLAGGAFDPDGLAALLREDLQGILLLVDDIHASADVAAFLRFLVGTVGGAKVLATARERPEPLADAAPDALELPLGGLPPGAARALALELVGGRADRAERVAALGRGHPMALRLLAAAGPDAGGTQAERILEDAVLEGLDADLERAATALAVLRKPAPRASALGVPPSALRRLLRRGLAVGGGPGFSLHDLARDVLLPKVPPASLRAAHEAAAGAARARGDAIEAAFHLLEAGAPERAGDALLAAGPDLLDSPHVAELARLLGRVPPAPPARLLLADALDRLGRSGEARDLASGIAGDARHPLRADALLLLGRIASRRNELGEARSLLDAAVLAASGRGSRGTEGRARRVLALVHRKAGALDLAEAELARAVPLLAAPADARDLLRARLDRAVLRLARGDTAGAGMELEALRGDPARGPREEAAILSNLAIVRARSSRPTEAARLFEESARIAQGGGDFRTAGYALANAADAYLAAGQVRDADASLRRAREISRGFADALLDSTILTNEGKVLSVQGDAERAEVRLREGVERIRDAGNALSLRESVDELARFYEEAGRAEDARRVRSEAEGMHPGGARAEAALGGP